MKKILMALKTEDAGQGMVEYALVVALIAVAVIATVTLLRQQLIIVFNNIRSGLMSN